MISNLHKNVMGTTSFDAKFEGMRKSQEFDVYPVKGGGKEVELTIQSDTRIGTINMETGAVKVTRSFPSGAYFHHIAFATAVGTLSNDALTALKEHVMGTASRNAGSLGVYCDNSGAASLAA